MTAFGGCFRVIQLDPWRGGRVAEGAPLLREYAVDPASRVRIPPSPPSLLLFVFAFLLWAPAVPAAGGAKHPLSTQREKSASPAKSIAIRVIDKVTGRWVTMAFPLDVTVPLPGGAYRLRVARFTQDFVLPRPPKGGQPIQPKPPKDQPAPSSSASVQDPDQGAPKPVPRARGEDNPAAFVQLFRGKAPVAATWIFWEHPYLFQPTNVRYTFVPVGVESSEQKGSARSSAG